MSENRPRRAFTLTELLVAIGIIVILIGLLLPAVSRIRKASYTASTQNQITVLSTAIEQYHSDFNAYPGPLPLNQINVAQSSGSDATAIAPFVTNLAGNPVSLSGTTASPSSLPITPNTISGPENLVLGLMGGLTVTRTPNASGQQDITSFQYDPTVIFTTDSSGALTKVPGPKGPSSLSLAVIKTSPTYLTVTATELSAPTATASFVDAGSRSPTDTIIPVFLDKYPDAMPILYMRASRGAAGLVSFAGADKQGGSSLSSDPATSTAITSWQYDLREISPYTTSQIGLNVSKIPQHGLQKVWVSDASPGTIASNVALDAWIYLRNPDMGPSITPPATDIGTPRQKDGYILISAGPDRTYGTTDDITSFGSVAP